MFRITPRLQKRVFCALKNKMESLSEEMAGGSPGELKNSCLLALWRAKPGDIPKALVPKYIIAYNSSHALLMTIFYGYANINKCIQ